MWYGHFSSSPSENLVKRLFPPPHPRTQEWVRQLDYYPGWRQCQYLTLNTASGYTSGLTVYFDYSLEYLTGIMSHGHANLALGSPWGVPIHFALRRGEYLISAWLHVRGFNYGSMNCFSVSRCLFLHFPLLTELQRKITTNYGRVRHFGNHKVVRQHHCRPQPRRYDTPCRWIRISDDHLSRIDGLFIDANEYLRRGESISTIGVAQHQQSQVQGGTDIPGPTYLEIPPSTTALPEYPFSLSPQMSGFLHSTASLTNIHEIRVRKQNGRCLGMHLSYDDSTVETLGQWDPTDRNSIMKIYDAMDGVLLRLSFHTRLENDCLRQPQIERISIEVTANTPQLQGRGEVTSDHANSCDPDLEVMEESVSRCGSCGRSRCRDSTLRRQTMVKTFHCYQPGQVSRHSFE